MQENVTPITIKKESLVIDGNSLVINSFKIVNPELVEFLATKANIEEAFIDLLNAALFVRRLSEVSIETEALNSVADKVKTSVEKAGDDAVDDFAALIKSHCDIENPIGLARLLRDQVVPAIVHELNPKSMSRLLILFNVYQLMKVRRKQLIILRLKAKTSIQLWMASYKSWQVQTEIRSNLSTMLNPQPD